MGNGFLQQRRRHGVHQFHQCTSLCRRHLRLRIQQIIQDHQYVVLYRKGRDLDRHFAQFRCQFPVDLLQTVAFLVFPYAEHFTRIASFLILGILVALHIVGIQKLRRNLRRMQLRREVAGGCGFIRHVRILPRSSDFRRRCEQMQRVKDCHLRHLQFDFAAVLIRQVKVIAPVSSRRQTEGHRNASAFSRKKIHRFRLSCTTKYRQFPPVLQSHFDCHGLAFADHVAACESCCQFPSAQACQ